MLGCYQNNSLCSLRSSPPGGQSATLAAIAAAAEAVRYSLGAAQQALVAAARDASLGLGASGGPGWEHKRVVGEQESPCDGGPDMELRTPTAASAAAAQRSLFMYQVRVLSARGQAR